MATAASRSAWSLAARQAGPAARSMTQRTTIQQTQRAFTSVPSPILSRLLPSSRRSVPSPSSPILSLVRRAHSIPRPPAPRLSSESSESPKDTAPKGLAPHYELSFTCKPCGARSRHNVSKQGYHHGSVLIACPSCKNRHVISDHLGIFGQGKRSLDDIMKETGQLVKKGTLGVDGDIEFWQDGTTSGREQRLASEGFMLPQSNKEEARPGDGEDQKAADNAAPGSTFAKGD